MSSSPTTTVAIKPKPAPTSAIKPVPTTVIVIEPAPAATASVLVPVQPVLNHPVIDLTGEADDDLEITYPTISEYFAELDVLMPVLRFPQYEDRLFTTGFRYVHQITDTPAIRATLANLWVPITLVEEIVEHAGRMTRRAMKSRLISKNEDETYCGF